MHAPGACIVHMYVHIHIHTIRTYTYRQHRDRVCAYAYRQHSSQANTRSFFLIKLTSKMHEFRRNLDDAILHARRRTMSRWKALTLLQNISANQRDRIPRRDTRRAQTRKLTFFILFFEITCILNFDTCVPNSSEEFRRVPKSSEWQRS